MIKYYLTVLTIDLLQTDNTDSKACDKVVQSYKRNRKNFLQNKSKTKVEMITRQIQTRKNKIQNMLTVLSNIRAGKKPTKPTYDTNKFIE